MCNLADGIEEKGYNRGYDKCIIEMIVEMNADGYKVEQIAKITKKSMEEVKEIIERERFVKV